MLLPPDIVGLVEFVAQGWGTGNFAQVAYALPQSLKSRVPHLGAGRPGYPQGRGRGTTFLSSPLGWDSSSPPGFADYFQHPATVNSEHY